MGMLGDLIVVLMPLNTSEIELFFFHTFMGPLVSASMKITPSNSSWPLFLPCKLQNQLIMFLQNKTKTTFVGISVVLC